MPDTIPLRACLLSLALGTGAWVYFLCLPLLVWFCAWLWGDDGAFFGAFASVGLLLLLALAAGVSIGVGVLLLGYYGLCYPSAESKRPVVVRCGLYLLPSCLFCVGLPWLLAR